MPHLSPMNWLMAPILFTLVTLPMLVSSLWWAQMPQFPQVSSTSFKMNTSLWNWN